MKASRREIVELWQRAQEALRRGQAWRLATGAANEIRAGHHHQGRQSPMPHHRPSLLFRGGEVIA
jgi:hypothetical protein